VIAWTRLGATTVQSMATAEGLCDKIVLSKRLLHTSWSACVPHVYPRDTHALRSAVPVAGK